MMAIARRLRVSGLVQGVFFRVWTRDQADELGIAGWVRNCGDGSVEARIEGEPQAVSNLIERMRRGPPNARVDDLKVEEAEPEGSTGFDVRR